MCNSLWKTNFPLVLQSQLSGNLVFVYSSAKEGHISKFKFFPTLLSLNVVVYACHKNDNYISFKNLAGETKEWDIQSDTHCQTSLYVMQQRGISWMTPTAKRHCM